MKQIEEDIDLIEFFLIIWSGKKVILSLILISVLIGWSFTNLRNDSDEKILHESDILYKVENINIFKYDDASYLFEKRKVLSDFQTLFNTKAIFDDWNKNSQQSQLNYKDIANTKINEGVVLSKNNNESLLTFQEKKGLNYIVVKTNQLSYLNDLFDYVNYLNNVLTTKYYLSFQNEYNRIEYENREFNASNPQQASNDYIYRLLIIENYLSAIDAGQKVLTIKPPSAPLNVSKPRISKTIIISGFMFLGGSVGVFVVFISDSIKRRKKNNQINVI